MSIQILIHMGFFVFDCNRLYIWYDIHIIAFSIHFGWVLNFSIMLTNCYSRAIITMIFSIVVIVISIVGTYTTFFFLSSSPELPCTTAPSLSASHIGDSWPFPLCTANPWLRCGAVSKWVSAVFRITPIYLSISVLNWYLQ